VFRRLGVASIVVATTAGAALVALALPASAVAVSTEAELRAAFETETVIDIQADITLTDCTGGGDVGREDTVTDPVTLDGHGHTIRQTCPQRVFFQGGSGLMTVRNLTIRGGLAQGNGGGILSASPLILENTIIVENRSTGAGGGIGSDGPTTIIGSTIDSNISSGVGGGISTGPNAHELSVTGSTVSNNVGGGIGTDVAPTSVTVVNSTITGNSNGGPSRGGGIFSSGSTKLVYATIVGNTAGNFGNIATSVLESFGSVIARSNGTGNCQPPATTSHGYNFSDDDLCNLTDPTDREDAGDPGLGPLAPNGGPTRTLLPEPGTPLIDAIPTESCQSNGAADITADQRGVTRPQGPGCDIGAVEVEVLIPPVPPPAPPVPPAAVVVTPRFTG
jgi:Right handed beta helix region